MEQAAELRRGLQALAEQLGESVAWQMAAIGKWSDGGAQLQEKLAIVDRTTRILTDIGIPPVKIEELKRPWHKTVMTDLARSIAAYVRRKLSEHMAVTSEAIMAEKRQRSLESRIPKKGPH